MVVPTALVRGRQRFNHISRSCPPNKDCHRPPLSVRLDKHPHLCSINFCSNSTYCYQLLIKSNGNHLRSRCALPEPEESEVFDDRLEELGEPKPNELGTEGGLRVAQDKGRLEAFIGPIPEENSAVISACLVGLLTGISVVVFNNGVHEVRDFFWDGIPYRGASWLREQPIELTWGRTVLVPVCGGLLVAMLNAAQEALKNNSGMLTTQATQVLQPFLKSVAACVTLGTGNSLGPEGPSVEIGSSVARGVGSLLDKRGERKVSLVAAGSAAGISSG